MTAIDIVLDALTKRDCTPTKSGSGWSSKCPAHHDRKPSLAIGYENDRVLVHCHADCEPGAIVDALGLAMSDLFDAVPGGRASPTKPEAEYSYIDEQGTLLYQVVRTQLKGSKKKKFSQRRPTGSGQWDWFLGDVRRVLYRLPDIVGAGPDTFIFIVEGEKDADRLATIGLVATTNSGGAGKWRPELNEALRGRQCVVVPDNDDAGRKHADAVIASLLPVAATVRRLDLTGLPTKGDVSDFLDACPERESDDLIRLAESAEIVGAPLVASNPPPDVPFLVRDESTAADITPIRWLWGDRLACGMLHVLCGAGGGGKSTVVCDWIARITKGAAWPDGVPNELCPAEVVLFNAEDPVREVLLPRLVAAGADLDRVHCLSGVRVSDRVHLESFQVDRYLSSLDHFLAEHPAVRFVVLDPVTAYLGRIDGNAHEQIRGVLAPVAELADQRDVAVLFVHHIRKSPAGGGSSSAGDRMLGSVAWRNVSRTVHMTCPEPDEPGMFRIVGEKSNVGPMPSNLLYRICPTTLVTKVGETIGTTQVEWERPDENLTAEAAFRRAAMEGQEPPPRERVSGVIREALDQGPTTAEELSNILSQRVPGVSQSTIDRARGSLRKDGVIKGGPGGKSGPWIWQLVKPRR